MPTFEYQAQGTDGAVVSGVVFGTSMDAALGDLNRQGLQVLRIGLATNFNDPLANPTRTSVESPSAPIAEPHRTEVAAPRVSEGSKMGEPPVGTPPPTEQRNYFETSVAGPLVGKVGLPHLLFFFRQSSTMLEAGVPIVQTLHTLSRQSRSPKLTTILKELVGHVEAGRPMSAGFQRYPEVFTPVMVSLVRAGEEGGFLDRALATVADYLEKEIALRNLYKRVTFYPKLQVAASVVIILGANAIIASIKPGAQGLSSPLTTPSTWIWLGPLIIGLFLFFRLGLANSAIKTVWDSISSYVPGIGKTVRQLAMAKFGRAFGALYRGGVPVPRAFQLAADSCGNEYLRALMYPAAKELAEGKGVYETFEKTGAFNPIVLDMVHTGETTGNLDGMLNKVADYFEDEAATRSTQTGLMMGVLIGLFVAAYIGYIVVSFYSGQAAQTTELINGT